MFSVGFVECVVFANVVVVLCAGSNAFSWLNTNISVVTHWKIITKATIIINQYLSGV